MVAGVGFEPHDLRVMSPTSYQAALPRDIFGKCYYTSSADFLQPPFFGFLKFFRPLAQTVSFLGNLTKEQSRFSVILLIFAQKIPKFFCFSLAVSRNFCYII